jgi:hypothetical protein
VAAILRRWSVVSLAFTGSGGPSFCAGNVSASHADKYFGVCGASFAYDDLAEEGVPASVN